MATHADWHLADRDRRAADETSVTRTRAWTVGAVIVVATILWFVTSL
jgi:hypothetical protein